MNNITNKKKFLKIFKIHIKFLKPPNQIFSWPALVLLVIVTLNCKTIFAQQPNPLIKKTDLCQNTKLYHQTILNEIITGNYSNFDNLLPCFKNDRALIMKAVMLDYELFSYANPDLHQDLNFIKRLVKINPLVLKLCPLEVRSNLSFMEEMTYIDREALRFASWGLLDNKPFMTKMIEFDSQNYKFASDRLRSSLELAEIAFKDNGLMLKYAPYPLKNDEKFVKLAIESDARALEFASKKLREDKKLIELANDQNQNIDLEKLKQFIFKHYYQKSNKKNLDDEIVNQAKFHSKKQIFNRNFITKWQKKLGEIDPVHRNFKEEWKLINAESKNYQNNFKEDLKNYPKLIEKITNFLTKHRVDINTIDNLKTTFLWKVSDKPLTLAFNIYFLRDSADNDLGSEFANITSLTIIASDNSKPTEKNNNSEKKLENNNNQQQDINDIDNNKTFNYQKLFELIANQDQTRSNYNNEDDFEDEEEISKIALTAEENQEDDIVNDQKKSDKEPKKDSQANTKKPEKKKTTNPKKSNKIANEIKENKDTKWSLSVIEAIFDSETKVDSIYRNGHKKYILWDLFKSEKNDKNPKIIFKVEDAMNDYFEVFARQNNGKYKIIFSTIKPIEN